ncbi:nuclear transport factor 2 family protein [Actinomadura macrotermitis]|uniref:SnoaL-like domain-containing protein n=1 Tax=Actinomadura macrotermitis TaxID=2585200 RepID=A0A7K0BV84_9ACTN|nr:nuclear transport factor 2 family protein [Actinomadura macrotermitis]MQY05089.1 hypothetical protein [Actinomadura macrotermitis]
MTGATVSLAEMLDERRHLLDVTEWMFGADAADRIVQETYRRWYSLDEGKRAGIAAPRAWLTRVAGGICLGLLAGGEFGGPGGRTARADTGGLPEPRRTLDPVIGRLRRQPRQDPSDQALLARHDHVVHRFAAACGAHDTAALKTLLAGDAIVVSDGGGKVRAAARPAHGADAAARFMAALLSGRLRLTVTVRSVNGRTGLVLYQAGQAVAVVSVSTAGTEVTAVWITLNPDKLRRWHRPEHGTPAGPSHHGGERRSR